MINYGMEINQIKSLYENGLNQNQIAKIIGIDKSTISYKMRKAGIKTRNNKEAHYKFILTDKLKQKIRDLYLSGLSYKDIMKNHGYPEKMIRACIQDQIRSRTEQDQIKKMNNKQILNENQIQLMMGTLLGDGCLMKVNNSYILQINHGLKQKGYIEHKHKILNCKQQIRKRIQSGFGKGKPIFRLVYQNKGTLEEIAKTIFVKNKKKVTKKWMDIINNEGLAYWFMDDGCSVLIRKKYLLIRFMTHSFSLQEQKIIISMLAKFRLIAKLRYTTRKKFRMIELNRASSEKFMDLVKPYVQNIPCMKYKIKQSILNV